MRTTTKVTRNLSEYESVIDVYTRNGFKIKSKGDTRTELKKKTRTKKWRWTKPSYLFLFKFVVGCCTLFVVPILYNVLHTKKEEVIVKLEAQ